jgi:hypothetical protein
LSQIRVNTKGGGCIKALARIEELIGLRQCDADVNIGSDEGVEDTLIELEE